jgi:hypothetical protein
MREFFMANHTDLQYAFFAFTAVAIIFGNKYVGGLLSRVPGLTRPGGFYSQLIIVIAMVGFMTALDYAYDRLTNHLPLHVTQQVLQLPISEAEYAVGLALPIAVLFFTFPSLGHVKKPEPTNPSAVEPEVPWIIQALGQLMLFLGYYLSGVIGVFFARQYLFNVLHWFGQFSPNNTVLFIAALALPITQRGGTLLQDLGKRIQQGEISGALGCVVSIGSILLIPFLLFTLALFIINIGFGIYFVRQVGWVAAIIAGVSFAGSTFITVLSIWVDNLKSKQLVGIFTLIPGGIAAVIQFGLSNPAMLPK